MKTTRMLKVAAVAATALTIGGCSSLPILNTCPDPCNVSINIPENPGRPPETGNETVLVAAGSQVQFRVSQPVIVVFPEETPFEDSAGEPLYWLQFNTVQKVRVRDGNARVCERAPGCKYMVIDGSDASRPVLDPFFIIDR